jgi:hypothetical protein
MREESIRATSSITNSTETEFTNRVMAVSMRASGKKGREMGLGGRWMGRGRLWWEIGSRVISRIDLALLLI